MFPTAIVATILAVVPLMERCRSVFMQSGFVPEVSTNDEVFVGSPGPSERVFSAEANVLLRPVEAGAVPRLPEDSFEFEALPLPVPEADSSASWLTLHSSPEAERKLGFDYVMPPLRYAVPRVKGIAVADPRTLSSNAMAMVSGALIYSALADGSVSARAPKWRMPLVQMLVYTTPGTDFDRVYGYLLRSFAGNDDHTKIRALSGWVAKELSPCEAADVYRAETRYWLNLGDSAMTADAAKRMEKARPDYAVRARRLSALSYATSGELEKAKAEIARSRAECDLPSYERLELLYLEAWIWLQEGDVEAARRNLNSIVNESPRSALARKTLSILESIPKED